MTGLRNVVACYPALVAISERLSATDFASLGCVIGLDKTTNMFSKYSDPLRDMPEYSDWFEDMGTLGCKIALVGRDVRKLFSRIYNPERYDRSNEVDLTIWPAVLPVDQYHHNRDVMKSSMKQNLRIDSANDYLIFNITLRKFEKSIVVKNRDIMAWAEIFTDESVTLNEDPEQCSELCDTRGGNLKYEYTTGMLMVPDNLNETHPVMTGGLRWHSPMKPNANNISTVFTVGCGIDLSSIQAEIRLDTYDFTHGGVDKVTSHTGAKDISRMWSANLVDMSGEQLALADIAFTTTYWNMESNAIEDSIVYPTEHMSRFGGRYRIEFMSLSGLEGDDPEGGEYTGYGTFKIM